MISGKFQIVALFAILVYYLVLFYMLKKKRLSLRYTLLWIFSGFIMLVLAVFPGLLTLLADLVGIAMPTNALFAVVLFCMIMLLISMTAIVSKQSEQIKRLTQSVALLEQRVRTLESDDVEEKEPAVALSK